MKTAETMAPSQDNIPELFRVPKLGGLDVYEISVEQLQAHFEADSFTSVDYVKFCLERIRVTDPYLESVIEINPDAIQIAADLDEERRNGQIRSRLHGIPILVKDNMATKDKMQTTAGSWALLGSVVPRDAHTVALLRKAGAVILGHANMCEWASMRSSIESTGYSPRGGQTRNPYDLSRSPFGSSSGSAVAVAANIVPVAYGTETDTSVIGPAQTNGIVGIKPTVGLTSRSGVIPISENFDTVGTFGRTVADACYALNAIVGIDERDSATMNRKFEDRIQDYSTFLTTRDSLKGAIFGLPNKRMWDSVDDDVRLAGKRVLEAIKQAGARVIETDFPCWEEHIPPGGEWDWAYGGSEESEITVCKVDAYNGVNAYLSELDNTNIQTLEDIVAYNEANAGTEGASPGDHPAFPSGQDRLYEYIECRGIKDDKYDRALAYVQRKGRKEGIDAALKAQGTGKTNFDALIIFDRKCAGQQLAAQAGYPILTLPVGLDASGMPIGLSLHQTAWKEEDLIRWGSAIENLLYHVFGPRQQPTYRNAGVKNIPIGK